MARKNHAELRASLGALLGLGDTDGENAAIFTDYLNWAGRRITNKYPWPWRTLDSTFSTVAPYRTGTVAVTNGSKNVTFTGATLVSGMVQRTFSVALGGAYYVIASVNTGAGTAVLDRVYDEVTAAASSFYIYLDEYDLDETLATVEDLRIHSGGARGSLKGVPLRLLDDVQFLPTALGIPTTFTMAVRATNEVRRVRVWPIPNDTYWIQYRGLSQWVNLAGDGDMPIVPEDLEELLVKVAMLNGSHYADGKAGPSEADVEELISLWWARNPEQAPRVGMRVGLDSRTARGLTLDLSGLTTS